MRFERPDLGRRPACDHNRGRAYTRSRYRGQGARGAPKKSLGTDPAGGFIGPYLVGWPRVSTGGYSAGMAVLSAFIAVPAVIVLFLGRYLGVEDRAGLLDRYAPPP